MTTLVQRYATSRELAAQLGLDPDVPLVEWQTWQLVTPAEPDPDPEPTSPTHAQTVMAAAPAAYFRLNDAPGSPVVLDSAGTLASPFQASVVGTLGRPPLTGSGTALDVTTAPFGGFVKIEAGLSGVGTRFFGPEFTVTLWAERLGPAHSGGAGHLAGRDVANANFRDRGWYLQWADNDTLQFRGFAGAAQKFNLLTPTVSPGKHFIAVRHRAGSDAASVSVMVDGVVLAHGVAHPGSTNAIPQALTFGRNDTGHSSTPADKRAFNGRLDEIAYFDKVLTDAELAAMYAAGPTPDPTPPPPPATDPVWAWGRDDERTAALGAYSVAYGRQDITSSAQPLQATVQLAGELLGAAPVPTVGERFRLAIAATAGAALGLDPDDWPRFTGEVTDTAVDPIAGAVELVAAGRWARVIRLPGGGDAPLPAQLDGTRIRRVLEDARLVLPDVRLGSIDPGTFRLLLRPAELTSVGALVEQAVTDTGGQLVEQRTGALDWQDAEHRRDPTPAATLSGGAELLRPFRWAQQIGAVVNVADVAWGTETTGGVAHVEGATAAEGALGPLGQQFDTQLADEAAAYARATDIVGRRQHPAWQLPAVLVDVVRSAGAQRGVALALRHSALVDLTQLPDAGPYQATRAFVEGVTETFTRTGWQLVLNVADTATGGVGLRWIDVPADLSWDEVDPTLSWLDVAPITDPEDLRG